MRSLRTGEPAAGWIIKAARILRQGVLPTPFGPTMAMRARWGMESVMFSKISTGPNERLMAWAVNSDIAQKVYQSERWKGELNGISGRC